ncbi:MAG: hypothetical protein IJS29_09990 [Selenomonadaceae bacterium]|nr:hypothetical protein [Selenomonadaceae bacterium]
MGSLILKRGMKPTAEQLARIYANAPKSDEEIDLSDIPEITDEEWKKFKPARLREKNKENIAS